MNIECYFIGWNIKDTIHLTITHYKQFCSRIVYFDNYSDDGSDQIAKSLGVEVQYFGIKGELNDAEYLKVKNNCWKGSTADYVIVCDDDEILSFNALFGTASIFKTQGYEMYSRSIPKERWSEVNTGIKNDNYSKLLFFSPTRIKEIGYVYGCHVARPAGDVTYSTISLPVYHYRSVGGPQRLINRHNQYRPRLSAINKRWKLGSHYNPKEEETIEQWENRTIKEWEESFAKSEILF